MLVILQAGGLGTGGINFDAKVRRNSTEPEDLFIAHITGMDMFARALIAADGILNESRYPQMRRDRYRSFDTADGTRFERGELTLEALVAKAVQEGEPQAISGQQEKYEQILTMYL
jgi:xylose isomerase